MGGTAFAGCAWATSTALSLCGDDAACQASVQQSASERVATASPSRNGSPDGVSPDVSPPARTGMSASAAAIGFGITDDFNPGLQAGIGIPVGPVLSAQVTGRYVSRNNEISNKSVVSGLVETEFRVPRSPVAPFASVGVGIARESSSFNESDYGGFGYGGDEGSTTSPIVRVGLGLEYFRRTSALAPWIDVGYEVYTARELNNKSVLRAGLRVRF